jgi:hypothetical protein
VQPLQSLDIYNIFESFFFSLLLIMDITSVSSITYF